MRKLWRRLFGHRRNYIVTGFTYISSPAGLYRVEAGKKIWETSTDGGVTWTDVTDA